MADPVSTGTLARELGVSIRTVDEWASDGIIEPESRTAGGQRRWIVPDCKEKIAAKVAAKGAITMGYMDCP